MSSKSDLADLEAALDLANVAFGIPKAAMPAMERNTIAAIAL
jgi:hypothetical protein